MNGTTEPRLVTLYRIVRRNPPTVRDVMSNKLLGKQPIRPDPDVDRLWDGISVFDSTKGAKRQARQPPWRGKGFIAALEIDRDEFRVEKTRGPGHFTL